MTTTTNITGRSVPNAITSPRKHKRFQWNWGVALVIPYVIAMLLFAVGPALLALIFSFSDFTAGKPQFFMAGFTNYINVFKDPAFFKSYWNVIRFSVLATTTGFVGAISIALILSLTRDRVGGYARSAFFYQALLPVLPWR